MKKPIWKISVVLAVLSCLLVVFAFGCAESEKPDDADGKTYTITFITGVDSIAFDPIIAAAGEPITLPTELTRDGYRFDGWKDGDALFTSNVMPEKNVVLVAAWAKYYAVMFVTGVDSIKLDPIIAAAGDPIALPTGLTREGYRFGGWKEGGEVFTSTVMPEKNLTLTAIWQEYFTLTFVTGVDGLSFDSISAFEGDPITLPAGLTRDGYRFGGWKEGGEIFTSAVMPAKNITLTAVWYKLYTVTFNSGVPGIVVPSAQYVAGDEVAKPTVDRAGYTVIKWICEGEVFDFSSMPDRDVTLTAEWLAITNLPAVVVDLFDQNGNTVPLYSVTRETYVDSVITLANTEDKYVLDSLKSSFKGRGNGSWNEGDKKGYKIKFDKKQSVFGKEKNKHWVLIACNNFDDVTMARNYLAYNMAGEVFDGIEYTTPAYWVDLTVNGEYRGVYLLCEHVRVDKGRVDIESEYGVDDTGYLIEYDAYAGGEEGVDFFRISGVKYGFTVHSPDPEDGKYETEGGITKERFKQQIAYIKDYVSRVYRAALNNDYATFSSLVDVDSFVDMYILHELFKNVDTGYSSFYLYKKPGGLLYAGPAWDFDATTSGATDRGDRSPQGIYVADTVRQYSDYTASELFISLYKQPGFKNAVVARWKVLSPEIRAFLDRRLNDAVYEENKSAMGKNFAKWKFKSQSTAENDWLNDIKAIKTWLTDRISWLDYTWD
ncbi:MAG: CotH kinase family protein [Clostridiales bacterium]|nr:CotH kinase family protein [Clostridiales bacterium]